MMLTMATRIRNPDGANELRRQNRSYVFFREVQLSDKDEPLGAQGVPLTPGRSIAVDKALHVYGTPFFIEGELPIESELSKTPFRRLMIAQDTGSAIVGPARADLYFGAGADAGKVSGRLRHNMRFVMLVPKSLDPGARARRMPLPDPRPSAAIAKLLDREQAEKERLKPAAASSPPGPTNAAKTARPANDSALKSAVAATPMAQASGPQTAAAQPVPLPEPRPNITAMGAARRFRHHHPYRLGR
jgi:membrane-bound lytic murein transglycosylase A